MDRLFQGHYSLNADGCIERIRNYVNAIPDARLIDETDDALTLEVTKAFSMTHASIDPASKPSVIRGTNASDPGYIVYEHAISDQSKLLKHNLCGMRFPAPRHEVVGAKLILKYPADKDTKTIKAQHDRVSVRSRPS